MRLDLIILYLLWLQSFQFPRLLYIHVDFGFVQYSSIWSQWLLVQTLPNLGRDYFLYFVLFSLLFSILCMLSFLLLHIFIIDVDLFLILLLLYPIIHYFLFWAMAWLIYCWVDVDAIYPDESSHDILSAKPTTFSSKSLVGQLFLFTFTCLKAYVITL